MHKVTSRIQKTGCNSLTHLRHILMMVFIVLMAGAHNPALAEFPDSSIARTGVWSDQPPYLPTPYCESVFDDVGGWFESIADFFVDGITTLGEDTVGLLSGLGELIATGNPDTLIAGVNDAFSDFSSYTADLWVNVYSPIGMLSLIVQILPAGPAADYLDVAVQFTKNLATTTVKNVVAGFNPVKLANTVSNDLSEIGGDLTNLFTVDNLSNPLSLANEFLQLNQKWVPAGSLTYLFTEKDPATGLRKAVKAFRRQVEIINTYSPLKGNAANIAKVAGVLLNESTGKSKDFIDAIPDSDPEAKAEATKVATLFLTAFASAVKSSISDPNFDIEDHVSRHPIYSAERRTIPVQLVGSDASGSYYHPKVEDEPGCISLGDNVRVSQKKYRRVKGKRVIREQYLYREEMNRDRALCNVEDGRDVWWTRPVDYELVWGDNCSGGDDDLSIWKPVCPVGYISAGFVAGTWSGIKPLPNRIACLRSDPELVNVVDGAAAELKWLKSSDDLYDLTLYNRKFLGMDLMYAVPAIKQSSDIGFKRSLNIPVDAQGIPPSGEKSHCVNFYTEKYYKGFTEEICSLDVETSVTGGPPNYQMLDDGVSSFQCGEKVAGVEIRDSGGIVTIGCEYGYDFYGQDNFDTFRAKPVSSYIDAYGETVYSPKTIADRVALSQKAERDRLQALADAAVIGSIPILRSACTYEAPDYNAPDDSACFELGSYHLTGEYGLPEDWTEAVALLRLACDFSQPGSRELYCKTYEDTVIRHCEFDGVPASCNEAGLRYLGYYNTSSEIDIMTPEEKNSWSLRFFTKGCFPDNPFAEASLIGMGNGQACHRLAGVYYDNGWLGDAFNTYVKGCELNYANACDQVGTYSSLYVDFILNGWASNEPYERFYNIDLALESYNKSCSLGYAGGCNNATIFNDKLNAVEALNRAALAVIDINTPIDDPITSASEVSNSPEEGALNHVNHYFLELSHAIAQDASVTYHTRDGTAIAGEDYIAASGTATILAGDTYAIMAIEIIGDEIAEPTESFEMVISSPEGAGFPGGLAEIVVAREILDDDG